MWNFQAPKADRIDRLLREAKLPGSEWLSRNAFDALIEAGWVSVQGKRVKKSGEMVAPGQEIAVQLPQLGLLRSAHPAELLWMDPSRKLALFNKVAGIASYPLLPWENDTLANRVATFLAESGTSVEDFAALAEAPKLEGGLLQRLDRDTSGILAVALTKEVKAGLREAFGAGKFRKTYLAVVAGTPAGGEYSFELRDSGKVSAKESSTGTTKLMVKKRKSGDGFSLVEISTAQGSRHVVRACMAALGQPLVGDATYGGSDRAPFHQLHALSLELLEGRLFPGFPSGLEAPLPQSFLDCLTKLGID